MKIPTNGSGNGYYGHETGITSYMDNNLDTEPEVQNPQGIGDGDFSEYLWMENEEEFDKQVFITYKVNTDTISRNLSFFFKFSIGTTTIGRRRINGGVPRGNVRRRKAAREKYKLYRLVYS